MIERRATNMRFIVRPKSLVAANDCRNYSRCGSQCGAACGDLGSCFSVF